MSGERLRPAFVPDPGELVTDTQHDRVGYASAWDNRTLTLTLKAPTGDELWDTTEFRRPTVGEVLSARVARENRDRRWRGR
ncbi:hypothetical protein RKE29_02915 [Streptomyces sp. B1866]|uniref:hypothetical protein n=1 Tax=Streptomyces sp. B1866 TaxID=3075431 RepID=UPI00289206D6|nr:hypothetical protein [Streptomyces sp. B1866]MDT3395611.1 hypothetical protein [Streptomyces sp. B1866]